MSAVVKSTSLRNPRTEERNTGVRVTLKGILLGLTVTRLDKITHLLGLNEGVSSDILAKQFMKQVADLLNANLAILVGLNLAMAAVLV